MATSEITVTLTVPDGVCPDWVRNRCLEIPAEAEKLRDEYWERRALNNEEARMFEDDAYFNQWCNTHFPGIPIVRRCTYFDHPEKKHISPIAGFSRDPHGRDPVLMLGSRAVRLEARPLYRAPLNLFARWVRFTRITVLEYREFPDIQDEFCARLQKKWADHRSYAGVAADWNAARALDWDAPDRKGFRSVVLSGRTKLVSPTVFAHLQHFKALDGKLEKLADRIAHGKRPTSRRLSDSKRSSQGARQIRANPRQMAAA